MSIDLKRKIADGLAIFLTVLYFSFIISFYLGFWGSNVYEEYNTSIVIFSVGYVVLLIMLLLFINILKQEMVNFYGPQKKSLAHKIIKITAFYSSIVFISSGINLYLLLKVLPAEIFTQPLIKTFGLVDLIITGISLVAALFAWIVHAIKG